MDSLLDDAAVEIYRHLSRSGFSNLAPLLLVSKKQSSLAFSSGVLHDISLHEFFNTPDLVNEESPFRAFLKKCVTAQNPVATYLESIRLAAKDGAFTEAIALLSSHAVLFDCALFARGLFLIFANSPNEGLAELSTLLSRVETNARLHSIGAVVYRQILSFRPLNRRLFPNLLLLDQLPGCIGQPCALPYRCLNCFLYWFIIALNNRI